MIELSQELREIIEAGPMAHLTTINADGSPQVTVIWIGLDGDDIVSGHMSHKRLVQNIERDSRVVLSFDVPPEPGAFLRPYATLRATATVEASDDAWALLNRFARIYIAPDAKYPRPFAPGWITRYEVKRIGGIGPWVAK